MPTYEYACKSCGEHLEVVQSFKDDPLTECPACAGPLRKVFGNIGITFKGSGFYRTDSRASGSKPAETKAGETKAGEVKAGEAKGTDAKSAKSGEAAGPAASTNGSASSSAAPAKAAAAS